MEYKIVISRRDSLDSAVAEIQNEALSLKWEYNRLGGCGDFDFTAPIKLFKDKSFGLDYGVKIYLKESGTYTLRYQGKIQSKRYKVSGKDEAIQVSGTGYQVELNYKDVDRDYTSDEISVIVKDILDTDITPNTNITYSAGDVPATSFTPDSMEFNTRANTAFDSLAQVVGTREWGVDKDRKFFFKARSSTTNYRLPLGKKVTRFDFDVSSERIANNIIVIGGDVAGSPFTRSGSDAGSQNKWGVRDSRIQNSSIVTNSVADEFITARLAEFKDPVFRVSFTYLGDTVWESTVPIPLVNILLVRDTFGTKKFGEGIFNGLVDLRIERIRYQIDDNGNMTSKVELSKLLPDAIETIAQLEKQIEQLQSVGV